MPPELGGRIARNGFTYQDHVGVKCLLEMLCDKNTQEIWFEGEDDIVILTSQNGVNIVEMIQVKSNDLDSRWSVEKMLAQEILQKSLQRGRCNEDVNYRITTSYDVDDVLAVLKEERGSNNRTTEKIKALSKKIIAKKPNIPSNKKGHTVDDWLNKCWWEKLPDSIETLRAQNIMLLETSLLKIRGVHLIIDQRVELYQKLLSLVAEAGLLGSKPNLCRNDLEVWVDENLKNFSTPKGGTERLAEKMEEANISRSVIELSKDMKWAFTQESLNHTFLSQQAINKFKGEVSAKLQDLKISLDADTLKMSGGQFHEYCINIITQLAKKHSIADNIARGCMYDITNRCSHRFTKAKS
ncbi:MAG: DUF4297 domain-containing protein [Leptospiraceae bacterium]|nr:DUF4297 domain-containing protein [Leptospiraceae bacterium]